MTNARRYAIITNPTGNRYMAELATTGLRVIPTALTGVQALVDSTGALTSVSTVVVGTNVTLTYNKYALTGFNGSNNPLWAAASPTTIFLGSKYARVWTSKYVKTASGNIIVFGNQVQTNPYRQYHLGGYSAGKFNFQSLRDIPTSYTGDFPFNATSDQGNGVINPWGGWDVAGNNVLINYRGEFWKASETGYFHHYDGSTGLILGIAGQSIPFYGSNTFQAQPNLAVNTLNLSATKNGTKLEFVLNDESRHGGMALWEVSGLNTINIQTANVTLTNRVFVQVPTKMDELTGVPENSTVQGLAQWAQNPTLNVTTGTNRFQTNTRLAIYDLNKNPDVVVKSQGALATTYYLQRQLTGRTNLANWQYTGQLDLTNNSFFSLEGLAHEDFYITVLDASFKVICKLDFYSTNRMTVNTAFFGPFTQGKFGASDCVISRNGSQIYCLINMFGTWVSTTQNIFDGTADISNPKYVRFNFKFDPTRGTRGAQFGFNKAFFE
jgi:hypothetical protein